MIWLLSGGWWGLGLGLLLGGWPPLLAPFALLFGVCMAAVEATRSHAPDPRPRARRAAGLAVRTAAAGAVVVVAANYGAPPGWVAAGVLFPLAFAALGVAELREEPTRLA
jgi:hypothetical protein